MSVNKDQNGGSLKWSNGHRYLHSAKLKIVAQVEAGLPRPDACLKYGMANVTLNQWLDRYASAGFKRRAKVSDQKKREVVRAINEGKMTVKEAQVSLNLADASTVRNWIKQSKKENRELANSNSSSMQCLTANNDPVAEELSNARLKIAALETMIDIAEQQFKICIRKKPGAKQ